jgi:hypothetical protein
VPGCNENSDQRSHSIRCCKLSEQMLVSKDIHSSMEFDTIMVVLFLNIRIVVYSCRL